MFPIVFNGSRRLSTIEASGGQIRLHASSCNVGHFRERPGCFSTVAAICVVLTSACHGAVGPTQATPPLDSLELSGAPAAGTVGDRFPLKVIATNVHGETQDVTSRVTWRSSSEATAVVSGGELMLVGAGETEIRASLEQVSASFRVSVARRPPDTSTLSGHVSDSTSSKGVPSAMVQIVDGPNAGRSAVTDESGFYSLPSLMQGNFTVRVTRGGYETTEAAAALSADTRLDLMMKALPPPPFRGATYDVRVSVESNKCGIDLPSSGRLVLSGTMRRLTIRLIQGGMLEREYSGSLEPDGTFTGSMGLAGARMDGRDAHGVSTIKGLVVDSKVSGTERIASHLCPNGLGIVAARFSGPPG
jgi:hypothetical protein